MLEFVVGPDIEEVDSKIGQPTQDITSQYPYCQMDGFHFIPLSTTTLGLTRPVATKNKCFGDILAAVIPCGNKVGYFPHYCCYPDITKRNDEHGNDKHKHSSPGDVHFALPFGSVACAFAGILGSTIFVFAVLDLQ